VIGLGRFYLGLNPVKLKQFWLVSIDIFGQKFLINWFVENFIQPTYKIDMCPLACENHMFF